MPWKSGAEFMYTAHLSMDARLSMIQVKQTCQSTEVLFNREKMVLVASSFRFEFELNFKFSSLVSLVTCQELNRHGSENALGITKIKRSRYQAQTRCLTTPPWETAVIKLWAASGRCIGLGRSELPTNFLCGPHTSREAHSIPAPPHSPHTPAQVPAYAGPLLTHFPLTWNASPSSHPWPPSTPNSLPLWSLSQQLPLRNYQHALQPGVLKALFFAIRTPLHLFARQMLLHPSASICYMCVCVCVHTCTFSVPELTVNPSGAHPRAFQTIFLSPGWS